MGRRSRYPKCKICGAVSYSGKPGMTDAQCIPHSEDCQDFPSYGQQRDAREAEDRRIAGSAADAALDLTENGFTAISEWGTVKIDGETAQRLARFVRGLRSGGE